MWSSQFDPMRWQRSWKTATRALSPGNSQSSLAAAPQVHGALNWVRRSRCQSRSRCRVCEKHNVYKNYRFFVQTADNPHVDLNSWSKEEVANATIDACRAVHRREVLNTHHISLWLLNAVFWSDHVQKSIWYTRDTDWAKTLPKARTAVDSVTYLDPERGAP